MKIREALQIARAASARAGQPYRAYLATGSSPLHLETLLVAHLAQRLPDRPISCATGTYGDLLESTAAVATAEADGVAVVIEYRDLDPRLGLRRTGGWTVAALEDAAREAEKRLKRLAALLEQHSSRRIVISLPTLPPPPAFVTPRWRSSAPELRLRHLIEGFAVSVADLPHVTVLSEAALDRVSPSGARHDVRTEFAADFPYSLSHASALAEALATALVPPPPLKGLITDLDDTLWRGLVGEIGAEGVSWSLDAGSHGHALYQQLLASLAETGVLLAIASKNDAKVVETALDRPDLQIARDRFFPVEAGWGRKSQAVARILARWNIGADAIALVDDSPLEIAEVQSQFPEIAGFLFPTNDDAGLVELIGQLRDRFGKAAVTQEDALRLDSLRSTEAREAAMSDVGGDEDSFLATLDSEIELRAAKAPYEPRAFELVNKTNQFNLNGVRLQESEWRRFLERPDSFLIVASYADKFGPLGRIGVVFGTSGAQGVQIEGWVLSCRAFSRRVEHAMLQAVFELLDTDQVSLAYRKTSRNAPVGSFLSSIGLEPGDGPVAISRSDFLGRCPALAHRRRVLTGDSAPQALAAAPIGAVERPGDDAR